MHDLAIEPHIVEAVLNHMSGHRAGVAGTYNHALYGRQKRAVLALWCEHGRSTVEGGGRKIVPFPTERGAQGASCKCGFAHQVWFAGRACEPPE
jgi:hypothetical protein